MSIGAAANLAGEPFFKKDGQRAVDRCFWIALLIDRLPMSSQARVISDEPCAQISLLPARKRLIDQITRSIIYSEPPLVIGVHGDWGSGKTSFLHFLNYWLTSDNTTHLDFQDPRPSNIPKNLVPVWFEAWRYQQESAPIVALLHEMRSKFTLWTRSQAEMKKLGEVAIRGALVALEDITKKIGIQASKIQEAGDAYEKERLSNTLPSAQLREFLDDALSKLLGSDKANNPRRLIVFIDDLDRCEPDTAYRLLEGLKIYLNLRRCIFVLGINQREVERALAKVMPSGTPGQGADTSALMIRAHEYMEKICANVWHLPRVMVEDQTRLLQHWLKTDLPKNFLDEVCRLLKQHEFLPCNARRTKAFANTLLRCYDINVNDFADGLKQGPTIHDAPLLCIVAVLQQFHPHLWRHVEAEPEFLLELQSYARGSLGKQPPSPGVVRRASDLHPELAALELPNDSGINPNGVIAFSSRFADLAYGNVLHCQRLLAVSSFSLQAIRTYLGR